MTIILVVVGGWVLLNLAIVVVLLWRRDPEVRAKLLEWVLPERQRRAARVRPTRRSR